jgi:zinc protease
MNKSTIIVWTTVIFIPWILSCQSLKGIKTVELSVPSDPTVSFKVWFKIGSQNDPKGKEGLASMTASLLAEGSTLRNKYETILEKLYPMAAGYGVSVDKEMTVFSGRVHRDNLSAYLDLYTQAILEPAFLREDFDRIKTNFLNYLENTLRFGNDEAFGRETLYRMVFTGTPYDHPDEGLIESVKTITLEDVKEFYQKQFTRNNCVIGIGGGYDKSVLKRLATALSGLPEETPLGFTETAPEPVQGLRVLLVEKNTRSTAISFGFPIDVLRGEKDFYALWIAKSWFGEHRNSAGHLYQVIRETRGMNYGDYSYIEYYPAPWRSQFPSPNAARRHQIFEVWIRPVQNQAAHFALRAAIRELEKLVDNGMTKDEFDLTRKFLKKYCLHYAETTNARLGYKLDDVFYDVKDHLKTMNDMMDHLTLEDVNAAIRKHLQAKSMKIAMITQNAESLKQALIQDKSSPMTYDTTKPPEVLEEDKKIESFPLVIRPENIQVVKADSMFVR